MTYGMLAKIGGEGGIRTPAAGFTGRSRFSKPAPYQARSPLHGLVGPAGIEPAPERFLRALPLPVGLRTRDGAESGTRTRTCQALDLVPLPLGYLGDGALPRIRTEHLLVLNQAPLPVWASSAARWWERKESNLAAEVLIYSQARLHNGLRSRNSKDRVAEGGGVEPPPRVARRHGFRNRLPAQRSGALPETQKASAAHRREASVYSFAARFAYTSAPLAMARLR